MLISVWRPKINTIVVCGLLALSLAGILISLKATECTSMKIHSQQEYTPLHNTFLDFDNMRNVAGKIPSDAELEIMTDDQLEDFYWSYVNTIQVLCKRIARIGKMEDGGKEVCMDEAFHPRRPCLVYSFGIGYKWDFDEESARMFGCEVFCFDPSMRDKGETYKYAKDITFYMIGLAAKNEILENQWKMRTLEQIRKDLNHTKRTIHILKIDIEGYEWTSIPEMVQSGTLQSVKQIQVELHGNGTKHDLQVLRMLYENGFQIFMRDRNLSCKYSRPGSFRQRTSCVEVSLIRVTS